MTIKQEEISKIFFIHQATVLSLINALLITTTFEKYFTMPTFHTTVLLGTALTFMAKVTTAHSRPNTVLTQPYYPPTAHCTEYKIPVVISSENIVFNFTRWDDDYALEDFLSTVTTRAGVGYPGITSGVTINNATYEIAASFCTPKKTNGKERTVILATHGIGQARTHWNSPYRPEEYNFVQWSISQGYSVFFYDRLGCGESQK